MNIDERVAAAERSARSGRWLGLFGIVVGAAGLVAGLHTRHALQEMNGIQSSIRTRELQLEGDHGDVVRLSIKDHEGQGSVELHLRGGQPGDTAAGAAELSFSKLATTFTVKPAGYGPHPQTFAQLFASDRWSTVTASSGSASTDLSAYHREPHGLAAVQVRTTEWTGHGFKKDALSV
ncbi:MAG: hypothetical protein IT380_26200, partial [Myxococcales bacterium]|nr:hypothetical protein [Myxococcales bacterium]